MGPGPVGGSPPGAPPPGGPPPMMPPAAPAAAPQPAPPPGLQAGLAGLAMPGLGVPSVYCSRCGDPRETGRRCQTCRRVDRKAWRRANPEKMAAYNRQYSQTPAGKESQARCNARFRAAHPDTARKWRATNLDRAREIDRCLSSRRRARQRQCVGSHTVSEWRAVLAASRSRCVECGVNGRLTKDHIVPLSRGGTDFAYNLQALCRSCNARKYNHLRVGTHHSLFDLRGE